MKIKLQSATVELPDGTTTNYTTAEMLRHIVRNGREFGRSQEATKVAQGIRILAALGSGDRSGELSDEDGAAIKAAVAKPSCGWSAYDFTQERTIGYRPDGTEVKKTATRKIALSPIDLYPLIDGVLTS